MILTTQQSLILIAVIALGTVLTRALPFILFPPSKETPPFIPGQSGVGAAFKQINWASIALGFAIIGLEAGFLIAYRAGWQISLAAGISNVIVSALLVFVGLLFYHEHLSLQNITGVALCIAGLMLMQLK